MQRVLKSYFFWQYPRGSFHYDVMVTLILAFIFVTPQLWNYGDTPAREAGHVMQTQVVGDGDHGLIITVPFDVVAIAPGTNEWHVRRALHQAIEPVTSDAVAVTHWETANYVNGQPTVWKVWAHR